MKATCGEIVEWIARPGGSLCQLSEDVSEQQANELRALVEHLRREVRQVQNELVVDPLLQSRSRAIASSISLTRVELEEVLTPGLRGYGALSRDTEAALDQEFERLLSSLSAIGNVLERGHSRFSTEQDPT